MKTDYWNQYWKLEKYSSSIDNNKETRVKVVDIESGEIIVDNEPYYPQPVDEDLAIFLTQAPVMYKMLKRITDMYKANDINLYLADEIDDILRAARGED